MVSNEQWNTPHNLIVIDSIQLLNNRDWAETNQNKSMNNLLFVNTA